MATIRIYIIPETRRATYETAFATLRESPTSAAWDTFARAIDAQFESRMNLERLSAAGDWESPELWAGLRRMLICRCDKIDVNDDVLDDLKSSDSGFRAACATACQTPGDERAALLLRYLLLDPQAGACTRVRDPLGRESDPHATLTAPEVEILQRHRDLLPKLVAALDDAPIAVRLVRSDIKKLASHVADMSYPYPTIYSVLS